MIIRRRNSRQRAVIGDEVGRAGASGSERTEEPLITSHHRLITAIIPSVSGVVGNSMTRHLNGNLAAHAECLAEENLKPACAAAQ